MCKKKTLNALRLKSCNFKVTPAVAAGHTWGSYLAAPKNVTPAFRRGDGAFSLLVKTFKDGDMKTSVM